MAANKRFLSIIIPAHNEASGIRNVLSRLKDVDPAIEREVIVVEDGSTDNTYELIRNSGVKVMRHASRKGYGASIKTGIAASGGDLVAILDADEQHDPADIIRLLKETDEYDMVVGERQKGYDSSLLRQFGKSVISLAADFLTGQRIPDINSGFRIFRKDLALKYIDMLPDGFSLTTTITVAFLRGGHTVKYVPIKASKRSGRSTINLLDGFSVILLLARLLVLFPPLIAPKAPAGELSRQSGSRNI